MSPKALVFFDLDGTLLNERSEMDRDVIQVLEQLKANGGVPFIATGRSPLEIQHVLDSTPIDSFITLNGQYIVYEGEEVYRSVMPKDTLVRLKEETDAHDFALSFYTADKIKATKETEAMVNAYKFIHSTVPEVDSDIYLREEILMALVFNTKPQYDQTFIDRFPELSFYRNTPYSMDTINKNKSKATGIKELVNKLQFKDIPTFAFGDGPNDIEMIRYADVGVAMDNAKPEIKEAADFVTAGNLDGGIAKALKHFELL
ncbi:Cof-type HAD-IIB family hydrolase [Pisciglobus halotolerans]|uniref:Cof subfamily of IIB subfamily of haloacid dehalogenase superfamily/HAD-superfamily hydrolase, subfamily IIB n=1 Tax=Pisciglobus halotolerans TaxID=745365 RepID=A0A1I3DSB0_9LACT|nr:Cof-type HAD-IIB family hydrolase [Pisciglobus halotolerans]SFH89438.1 hypothetical protein SAMN04489868_1505 [Pisciglobus halotolerans]